MNAEVFPELWAVSTSTAISSSGWFIQRYWQVMWVYLARAWNLFMQTRTGWTPPSAETHSEKYLNVKTHTLFTVETGCATRLIVWCLWGLLLSLFLESDYTLSVSFCTPSYSKSYRQSVCECICTSGLFLSVKLWANQTAEAKIWCGEIISSARENKNVALQASARSKTVDNKYWVIFNKHIFSLGNKSRNLCTLFNMLQKFPHI